MLTKALQLGSFSDHDIDAAFDRLDQDGDGKLGYDDVAWLMKATLTPPDDAWSTKNHDEVCAVVGAADKLITKEQFFASYETRLASIEEV